MPGPVPGSICDVLPAAAALLRVPGAVDRLALAPKRASAVVVVYNFSTEAGRRGVSALCE